MKTNQRIITAFTTVLFVATFFVIYPIHAKDSLDSKTILSSETPYSETNKQEDHLFDDDKAEEQSYESTVDQFSVDVDLIFDTEIYVSKDHETKSMDMVVQRYEGDLPTHYQRNHHKDWRDGWNYPIRKNVFHDLLKNKEGESNR